MDGTDVIERAFGESFWLGVAVMLVVSNLGFLVFAIKYFLKQLQVERKAKEELRDRYEAQQRDDMKLFMEVQNTLKEFRGHRIETLLEKISTKVDQLIMSSPKP